MQRKGTPGVEYRHTRRCVDKATCRNTCGGTWTAWVYSKTEGKKLRPPESFATQAAARGWRVDAMKAVKDGKLRAGDNRIKVDAWLRKWLDERAPQDASPRVVGVYRQSVEAHIIPAIGSVKLANLRRSDCNLLVTRLFEKGLARSTIKRTVTPLRLALDWAADQEKIGANPAVGLKIPERAPTRKLHVPTLTEVKRILDKADDDGREAILVCASLGLRKGELLALRWCDVDFDHNLVHVRRQNIYGVIEPKSKTDAGTRTAPLYATARATLEARAKRLGLTVKWLASDERLIFPGEAGRPVDPREWYRDTWMKARDAAGDDLTDVRLHDLRHFNVTALRELGMDGKLRSVITGHTDTLTTERIYDHVRDEHIERAAASFDPLSA